MTMEAPALSYGRYFVVILRRCTRLLGDEQEAQDATQDVFTQYLRFHHKLEDPEDRLRWLYRVSTNNCLNRLRKARRLDFPGDLPEGLGHASEEQQLEARQAVSRILASLDERSRDIFVHAYLDGMTQEEIAEVMNLSRKTVGKRLAAIREMNPIPAGGAI